MTTLATIKQEKVRERGTFCGYVMYWHSKTYMTIQMSNSVILITAHSKSFKTNQYLALTHTDFYTGATRFHFNIH